MKLAHRVAIAVILVAWLSAGCGKQMKRGIQTGRMTGSHYTNDSFGLAIDCPKGWYVEPIAKAEAELANVAKDDQIVSPALQKPMSEAVQSNYHLLGLWKYDPNPSIPANPSLKITVEKITDSTHMKSGRDYLNNVRKMMPMTKIPFKPEREIYAVTIHGKTLHRLDVHIDLAKRRIHQSCIATVRDGYTLALIITWWDDADGKALEKSLQSLRLK